MGKTKPFEAEKLVVGIMYTDAKDYSAVTETLRGIYGDNFKIGFTAGCN